MVQVELTWIEKQRFLGVDSTGQGVVLSPGSDVGVKPSDTLLIALAACASADVVEILHKQRAQLERLTVRTSGEQAVEAPWAYQRIHLHFIVTASGVRQAQLDRAVDLALNKYCSVRASLAPNIQVTFEAELHAPAQPS